MVCVYAAETDNDERVRTLRVAAWSDQIEFVARRTRAYTNSEVRVHFGNNEPPPDNNECTVRNSYYARTDTQR